MVVRGLCYFGVTNVLYKLCTNWPLFLPVAFCCQFTCMGTCDVNMVCGYLCVSLLRERENSQGKLEVNQLDMFKTLFLSWAKSFLSQSLFLVKDCSLLPPFIPPMCLKNYKSVILLLPLPPPLSLTILKITVGKILRLKWMYASGNVSQLVFYTLHWCNAVICKRMF